MANQYRQIMGLAISVVLLVTAALTESDSFASFVRVASGGNDYTFVLRQRAGPYLYWRTLKNGNAYEHAIAAFGRPNSVGKDSPESNVCTVRWENVGIDIAFAWASGPCTRRNLNRASWSGMRLFGVRWRTARGLRVGDPIAHVRRLYPRARYVSRPPRPGEWWLISQRQSEFGLQPLLVAEVGAGRVIAIRVPPPRL
jgi:hypothetical protein